MYAVKTPPAMEQIEILGLVVIYKNMPNYHGWLFFHSNDFFFPLPFLRFYLVVFFSA